MKFYAFLISCLFLITGCDFDISTMNLGVLHPMGEIAMQERNLLIISVLLMLIVIIPVILMVPIFAWKYRASNKKAEHKPEWAHSVILEIFWWGIPILIIIALATITWITSHKLDPYRPLESTEKPITIEVVALDWKWLFIYPEYDIATVNFIQFPVDVPLNFKITADAPMNSFFIPQLGGQIYAMAGMETKLHLIANKEGEFRGFSANYSGDGFSGMKFIAKASSKQEFENWVKEVKKSGVKLTGTIYNEKLLPQTKNNKVEYFNSVQKGLFFAIIAKFMPQMDGMSDLADGEPASMPANMGGMKTK